MKGPYTFAAFVPYFCVTVTGLNAACASSATTRYSPALRVVPAGKVYASPSRKCHPDRSASTGPSLYNSTNSTSSVSTSGLEWISLMTTSHFVVSQFFVSIDISAISTLPSPVRSAVPPEVPSHCSPRSRTSPKSTVQSPFISPTGHAAPAVTANSVRIIKVVAENLIAVGYRLSSNTSFTTAAESSVRLVPNSGRISAGKQKHPATLYHFAGGRVNAPL